MSDIEIDDGSSGCMSPTKNRNARIGEEKDNEAIIVDLDSPSTASPLSVSRNLLGATANDNTGTAAANDDEDKENKLKRSKNTSQKNPLFTSYQRPTQLSKLRQKRNITPPKEISDSVKNKNDDKEDDKAVIAGNRLYTEAKAMQRRLDEAQKKALERNSTLDPECTFKPVISRYSSELVAVSLYKPPTSRFGAADEMEADRKRFSMERKRVTAEEKELKLCTFKPAINQTSKALVRSRSQQSRSPRSSPLRVTFSITDKNSKKHSSSAADEATLRLYEEYQDRIKRNVMRLNAVEELQMAEMVGGGKVVSKEDAQKYARQLHKWGERREQLLEQMRNEMAHTYVNAARVTKYGTEELLKRLIEPDEQQHHHRQQYVDPNTTFKPTVCTASQQLAEKSRVTRYFGIFKCFAGKSNEVSVGTVRELVNKVYKKNHCILCVFLHDTNDRLYNVEEFCTALMDFERKYGPQAWGREETAVDVPQFTFKPKITAKSKEIVEEHRAISPREGRSNLNNKQLDNAGTQIKKSEAYYRLYNLGLLHQRNKVASETRRSNELATAPEDPECTFKPILNQRSRELGSHRNMFFRGKSKENASLRIITPLRNNITGRNDVVVSPLTDESTQYSPQSTTAAAMHVAAACHYTEGNTDSPDHVESTQCGTHSSRSMSIDDDILREIDEALMNHQQRQQQQYQQHLNISTHSAATTKDSSISNMYSARQSTMTSFASEIDMLTETVYATVEANSSVSPNTIAHDRRQVIVYHSADDVRELILDSNRRKERAFL